MLTIKRLLAALIAAAAVAALCSCSFQEERIDAEASDDIKQETSKEQQENTVDEEPAYEQEPALSKEEVNALAAAALEKLNVIPEYPAGHPTLDDVVSQYKKTCEAIGWIVGTELVATDGDYAHEAYGMKYYKVLPDCYLGSKLAGKNPDAQQLIYNKETLEAYLATLITETDAHEYVIDIKESFEVPKFTESKNGELYALPYAFPPAGYADDSTDTFELTSNGDGSYTLTVHYNTLDDDDNIEAECSYDVKYVKKDGRWVFEDFILVKQH